MAKRGHHVEVVHCLDAHKFLSGGASSMPYQDHPNVTVHGLKSPAGFLSPLVTQQTGRPALKSSQLNAILEKPFDVIHFHNISLVGGPKVLEYGCAVKLYTLHEYWLVCPTHMLFKFGQEVCTEQSCFACTIAHRRPRQLWRYTRMIEEAVNHVDLFIAPSEFTLQKHREMGLQRPISELPYFTSRWSHDQPTEAYVPREVPYFLFVGRLEKIKGLQTLIPVFRRYRNAQLWVAGTGEYEGTLRAMAAESPNIKFLGRQSGEQLRLLYEQALATIVPSIWYEVFGIVILESFTQKTPVIVSNNGGMPKVVNTSGGGFVFNTQAELLGAIDRLLNEPSLREQMGQRGYEALQQKWSAEVHIPQYLRLIKRAIATRA
ncbi:MAG: glycosyltransferase family 4 protein [Nitrospiraceae bacterium]|nr:glycosyltransferase family 4 protein [Nitrospiraceae bacterium]